MPITGRHGIYDLSGLHVSEHAARRFAERVDGSDGCSSERPDWSTFLRMCRKLGTNAAGDQAFLVVLRGEPFVLLLKGESVVTVMTLPQFESVMADFGRTGWPRRFGRWLRKIDQTEQSRQAGMPEETGESSKS